MTNQSAHFEHYIKDLFPSGCSLSRYGDGEIQIMRGMKLQGIDGWRSDGGESLLRTQLLATASLNNKNIAKGIPCTCHFPGDSLYARKRLVATTPLVASNIFVNCCAQKATRWIRSIASGSVVFTNKRYKKLLDSNVDIAAGLEKENIYPIFEDDCFGWWNYNASNIIDLCRQRARIESGRTFLFSAGPMATVICSLLSYHYPQNIYVDCGSILDSAFFNFQNRPYQNSSHPDSLLNCTI